MALKQHHLVLAGNFAEAHNFFKRCLQQHGVNPRTEMTILTPGTRTPELLPLFGLDLRHCALHWVESDRAFLRPTTSEAFENLCAEHGTTWTELRERSRIWLHLHHLSPPTTSGRDYR